MAGTIVLTGRAKDTIVLSNGENVEPQAIEDTLCCSPLIKFAGKGGGGGASCPPCRLPGCRNCAAWPCASLHCSAHTSPTSPRLPRPLSAVLVGSGHRAPGALIVPDPEHLQELAQQRGGCVQWAQLAWPEVHAGWRSRLLGLLAPPASSPSPSPVPPCPTSSAGVDALPAEEVRSLVGAEVRALLAARAPWEKVKAFEVLQEPFSVDDGTLTRTMKPRRAAIMARYAPEVASLEAHLR